MAAQNSDRQKREFAECMKAARIGVPEAQYQVGLMYAHGMGVNKNLGKAIEWISKAAERGVLSAQYLLATRYEAGVGVQRDMRQAVLWFEKAAHNGHIKSTFKLGKIYALVDRDTSEKLIFDAADKGLAEAQYFLGSAFAARPVEDGYFENALHLLTLAAQQGFAPAQCALGNIYAKGQCVPRDVGEAKAWLRLAAQQNFPAAHMALEVLDAEGGTGSRGRGRRRYTSGERRKASKRWESVLESGDADSRYHLGLMYELGIGIEQDFAKAEILYSQSARSGDARAQYALGKLLEDQNLEEAVTWYRKAADQSHGEAQFALGRLGLAGRLISADVLSALLDVLPSALDNERDALMQVAELIEARASDVRVACYARAAVGGSAEAQFKLADAYETGRGVKVDLKSAFGWYLKAANQSHVPSQLAVASMYLTGRGVKAAAESALVWFLRAAEADDPQAQWNVSAIYASGGEGVKTDLKQAFEWCHRSAEQGFAPAQASLGALYVRIGEHKKAAMWWQKAAEAGDSESQYNLAQMLLRSADQGSFELAFEWLSHAAEAGLVDAQSRLAIAYASGQGTAQDPVEAHKWFLVAASVGDPAATKNSSKSERLLSKEQLREAVRRAAYWINKHKLNVK
jgi:TPR repeat protein